EPFLERLDPTTAALPGSACRPHRGRGAPDDRLSRCAVHWVELWAAARRVRWSAHCSADQRSA
ncbi:hypothetical protein ACWDT6_04215, partial [Nocardia grenadensis]